jgi:hypothetical protein
LINNSSKKPSQRKQRNERKRRNERKGAETTRGGAKTEDKRHYKQWVQELLRYLDKLQSNRQLEAFKKRGKLKLHLWTDTLAAVDDDTGQPFSFDVLSSGYEKSDRSKPQSSSVESDILTTEAPPSGKKGGKGGRGGNNSGSEHSGKKKLHPRSKDALNDSVADMNPELPQVLICRSYFFTGKCDVTGGARGSGRRKSSGGGCPYVH